MFNPNEETSTTITQISFSSLPPNFFGKKVIFSLTTVVEKPLQVDLATQNKTILNCARVKIEVDLLAEFPKWINSGMRRKSEEVAKKWIPIRYDYVPKYCKECRLQGHNEKEYYVITYNCIQRKKGRKIMSKGEGWNQQDITTMRTETKKKRRIKMLKGKRR